MRQFIRQSVCALAAVYVGLLVGGCDGDAGAGGSNGRPAVKASISYPYKVTATVGMITDIVRQVAGDKATVQGMMKEGVDPHVYKPTRADVIKLTSADVVFYNGLMLEGKLGDVLVKVARDGKPVFAVTEMLDDDKYVLTGEDGHFDPHVWMDVKGWIMAVRAVATSLSEYDETNAAYYDSNAKAYIQQLEKLDAYAKSVIESIPKQQRVLVTAHDAFGYLGRAYGIDVRGVQGISTESEAGVRDINALVQFLVENRVGAVFVETSVADKSVRALIEGAAAKGHTVTVGGELFSDAMGSPGTYHGTYIGMIDHNVSTIAKALGGTVPEGGFAGTLRP